MAEEPQGVTPDRPDPDPTWPTGFEWACLVLVLAALVVLYAS